MTSFTQAEGAPLAYHFRNDGHWNAYGHQLVGDLLAQVLLERIEEDLERRRSLSGGASPAR